jgi:hypothetical protein
MQRKKTDFFSIFLGVSQAVSNKGKSQEETKEQIK